MAAQTRPGRYPSRRDATRYLLWRVVVAVAALLCATTIVFLVLYAGPLDPAETIDTSIPKTELGLAGPLWAQYLHFMGDVLTFDFESWVVTTPAGTQADPTTDGNALVAERLPQSLWISAWAVAFAVVVGLPLGLLAGLRPDSRTDAGALVGGTVARAAPAFLVAVVAVGWLRYSEQFLFGFDWFGFGVETVRLTGPVSLEGLWTPEGFLRAVKRALPASVALGAALLGTTVRVGRTAMRETRRASHVAGVRARGGGALLTAKHLLRNASVALVSTMQAQVAVLLGGVVVVEYAFEIDGVGKLFEQKMWATDVALAGALLFLGALLLVVVGLVQDALLVVAARRVPDAGRLDVGHALFGRSSPLDAARVSTGERGRDRDQYLGSGADDDRLRPLRRRNEGAGLRDRVRGNPLPALAWVGAGVVLLGVELGALADFLARVAGLETGLADLPTLLGRETIPNEGHRTPGGGWTGTFLGLPAATAWALRALAVYLYAGCWLAWLWTGYRLARSGAGPDRTPFEAAVARFRDHRWGQFGFVVVFVFVASAVFAPALAPTAYHAHPYDQDDGSPERFDYYDAESGSVKTVSVGLADMDSKSEGSPGANVGPLSYDDYGRFHPLGTGPEGRDLLAVMLAGSRLSLLVLAGTAAVALPLGVALGVPAATGRFERLASFSSEVVTALPAFPMLVALSFAFGASPLGEAYDGAPLLGAFVGALSWPTVALAVRRSGRRALAAAWVDAAEGFGRGRVGLLRRIGAHVRGDLAAALLVVLAGAFVVEMGLAFIWLGTIPPSPSVKEATPEWGFLVLMGREYLATVSWHVPLVPGGAVALVATGLTALADGVRDCAGSGRTVEGTATGAAPDEETAAAGSAGREV